MSENKLFTLLLLFFWIDFVVWWILFSSYKIFILWLINVLLLIYYFNKSYYTKIIDILKNQDETLNSKEDMQFWYQELFKLIKYYNSKYFFVLSWIILWIAIIDNFFIKKYWINLLSTFIIFFTLFCVSIQDIFNWKIFFWNRKIWLKDFLFIFSIFIVLIIYISLNKYITINKLFYSTIIWAIFYFWALIVFNYVLSWQNLFKHKTIRLYILIIMFWLIWYIRTNNVYIQNIFTKEKIVYQEKIVYKDSITKIDNNKSLTINEADKIISSFLTWKTTTWEYNSNIITWNMNDSEVNTLIDWLKWILSDTNTWTIITWKNNVMTYYDVIPKIVDYFNITSHKTNSVSFKYISKDDKMYSFFKIAYYRWFFWKNTDPSTKLKCKNLAYLIWIANVRQIDYNENNMLDEYYKKALSYIDNFNICPKEWYLTKDMLENILKK